MIFNKIGRPSIRSAITTSSELAQAMAASGSNATGLSVTTSSAMKSSTVYACITVIAETVAQLPLFLYENTDNGKVKATDHSLYRLLHDQPNEFQTSFDWRMSTTASALINGAGYSFINRSPSTGEILEILPIAYDAIELEMLPGHKLQATFTDAESNKIPLKPNQLHRMTGVTLDGWSGVSPIEHHRQTIGISLVADKHAALTFKNGVKFAGVLQHPTHFSSDEVAKRVKDSWDTGYTGDNSYGTPFLEDGVEFKATQMNNKDAQYIETRNFQIPEIARIFHMQLNKIGHLIDLKFSNREEMNQNFITDTMVPWFCRWEQSILRDMLGRDQAGKYAAKFNVNGLLRGNSKDRAAFYQSAVGGPIMSIGEARELEDLPKKDGYEDILQPLNMGTNTDESE